MEHIGPLAIQPFHIKEVILSTTDGVRKGFGVAYMFGSSRVMVVDNYPTVVLFIVIFNMKHVPKNSNSGLSTELLTPNHKTSNHSPTIGLELSWVDPITIKKFRNKRVKGEPKPGL